MGNYILRYLVIKIYINKEVIFCNFVQDGFVHLNGGFLGNFEIIPCFFFGLVWFPQLCSSLLSLCCIGLKY